jgi:hypothetical protein
MMLRSVHCGQQSRDRRTFGLPFTQEELARELSTTRESVSRALGELRAARVLAKEGGNLKVLSIAGLHRAAGADASLISGEVYAADMPVRVP